MRAVVSRGGGGGASGNLRRCTRMGLMSIRARVVRPPHEAALRPLTRDELERNAMRYMLLIYSDPSRRAQMSRADMDRLMGAFFTYTDEMRKAGVHRAGDPLKGTETATTVRVRDGKTLTTDGPFAETKEQLAGYYLVDVPDLDAALQWAARCPGAALGAVEVRPLMDLPPR